MADAATRFRIEAIVRGLENVEALKNSVKRLQSTASPAAADLNKLKDAAVALGSATDRTENDLRTAVAVLKDLRANVALNDAEFRKLTTTIGRYEQQLNRANGTGGRFGKIGQTLGAVAASGVFGGPEGLLGAGVGAFFGPGGALAGGAIGAQVGLIREQIAAMSDQAAQVQRLQIALKGITQTAAEYQAAMAVINSATREFNITREEAIQGFTGLSAAVIGAGGKVRDAELVFKGVSAAIRATGGSAEDVQGALTAMAQVFSKGKATAEEIQGQLGERLPGAVTLFAEATGRTSAELAKAFEQGTVGLNDVMKFAIALGDKYSALNQQIASSSEASGDRLKVAFASLREEIGRTFQPLGSAIQDVTAELAEAAVQMVLTARNSDELNAALDEAGQKSQAAAVAMAELNRTQAAINVDGGIGDAILQWIGGTNELETRLRKTDTQLQATITRLYEAEGAVNIHRKALLASGQTLDEQGKAINAAEGALRIMEGRLRTLAAQNQGNTKEAEFFRAKVAELKTVLESIKGVYKAKIEIQQIFSGQKVNPEGKGSLPEGYRVVAGKLAYQVPGIGWVDARTGQPVFKTETPDRGQSNFAAPDGGKADSGKDSQRSLLNKLQSDFDKTLALLGRQFNNTSRDELLKNAIQLEAKITKAIKDGNTEEVERLRVLQQRSALLVTQKVLFDETSKIEAQIREGQAKGLSTEAARARLDEVRNELSQTNLDLKRLENTELEKQAKKQAEINKERAKQAYDQALSLVSVGNMGNGFSDGVDSYLESLGTLRDAIKDVTVNGFQALENAIIQFTMTGKTSFREFALSVISDLTRMITRMFIMAPLLQFIQSLLPGGGFLSGTGALSTTKLTPGGIFANGGTFANGIKPFASGGIVTRPTMFKFANGGYMNTGLMGEAGPEAIIPLKRGADGKLGVAGGGGGTVVNVSVDAKGTSVQGNSGQGEQLGRAISQAVQAELIKQRRPGGLLAA